MICLMVKWRAVFHNAAGGVETYECKFIGATLDNIHQQMASLIDRKERRGWILVENEILEIQRKEV